MNGHCKEFFPTIRLIITHNYGYKSKKRIITIGFGVMYMRLLSPDGPDTVSSRILSGSA